MTDTQADLHNRLAGQIVASIVRPPIEAGGDITDVMVLTESVLAGVILTVVRPGGDEVVLDVLFANVKRRLAEIRLGRIETGGSA